MRHPVWLRHPRQTTRPVIALCDATLGNLVVVTVIILIISLPWGPGSATPGAAFGAGLMLGSTCVTWIVTRLIHRLNSDPAFYLLVAYVVKALVGLVAITVVPFPESWSGTWALIGVVACVVAALGTQVWVIWRLRIPYFLQPLETDQERRRPSPRTREDSP